MHLQAEGLAKHQALISNLQFALYKLIFNITVLLHGNVGHSYKCFITNIK